VIPEAPEDDRIAADLPGLFPKTSNHEVRSLLVEAMSLLHLEERDVDVRPRGWTAREHGDALGRPRREVTRTVVDRRRRDERSTTRSAKGDDNARQPKMHAAPRFKTRATK